MIKFYLNSEKLSPGSFWYHYKEHNGNRLNYKLIIEKNEQELLQLIESYSERKITSAELGKEIILKDKFNRSSGLMWHILNFLQSRESEQQVLSWNWVINNINKVQLEMGSLIIAGEVSPYDRNLH